MLDNSIDGALLALRKQIIRGKLDGLGDVEALLVMRGVDMPEVCPEKHANAARRGHMAALIREALRGGPMRYRDIVAFIAPRRPEITREVVYKRTARALARLRDKGTIKRERRVWSLR